MTPRIFLDQPLLLNSAISLDKDISHYLQNVLRLKVGAEVCVFNGVDGEWQSVLVSGSKRTAGITLQKKIKEQINTKRLGLIFAPTKNINSSYIVEKATELGVTEIYPVLTQRSVVTKVNIEKLNIAAREAAEQCERMDVAKVYEIKPLYKFLSGYALKGNLIFCDEAKNCQALNQINPSKEFNAIVIGPEGGFTEEERTYIRSLKACIPVHMGQRILRADTAAISALAAYQALYGDWDVI